MAKPKPYEQNWLDKLATGALDGMKYYINSSDGFSKNSYQRIVEIKDGAITVTKIVVGKFFDGKENEKFRDATVEVLSKPRDNINLFKKDFYKYVEKLDFSEFKKEKAEKLANNAIEQAERLKSNMINNDSIGNIIDNMPAGNKRSKNKSVIALGGLALLGAGTYIIKKLID